MSNQVFSPAVTAAALCVIWASLAMGQAQLQNTDELRRAETLSKQGAQLCNAGKFGEAEHLLREVLDIRQRLLPAGSFLIGTALNDLGAALHYQSRFQEAEALYLQSISILEGR